MPPKRKKRANWPYRLTILAMLCALALYISVQVLVAGFTFAKRPFGTDWGLAIVSSLLDATIAVWFVSVGACIGSFLNVVAYRLPLGRNIGGHSGCPYCQTPIDGMDNVPVLAWIKLRGRCRACRLPISAQYPLVELTVAILFFVVYVSEFLTGGGNLPADSTSAVHSRGFMGLAVTSQLAIRIGVYLFALSGLVAAALMAVKNKIVPLRLYAWSLMPLAIAAMLRPDTIIQRWRTAPPVGPIEERLDALTTMLCGLALGIGIARLIAPLVYRGFDRSLMSGDRPTVGARAFLGAMGVAGAMLGWQAVIPMAWAVLLSAIVAVIVFGRYKATAKLGDLTVWVWLGVAIFRAGWVHFTSVPLVPAAISTVVAYVAGALLLAPAAALFSRLATPPETLTSRELAARETENEFDEEEEDDEDPPTTLANEPDNTESNQNEEHQ